jgi:tetratricopeptide (TPR) repeat protein
MLIPDAPRSVLRQMLLGLAASMVIACGGARADDLQDAAKLLKGGQHQQAMERVNKVLASKPRDPQARFLKGLIYTEQGNTKEAVDIFTKLTQDYPELPEPYNNLAVIYASQGQYEKARTALEQSIRTHPSYATAYENLGDVYAKLASQAYDKALQIDSSNAGAQNKLSLVRELVGGPTQLASKDAAKPPLVLAQKPQAPAANPSPSPQKPAAPPAQKPAAEKPAAAKPSPEANTTAATAEIVAALNGWAKAWSKKDADAYLAYYAKEFKTTGGEPRAEWEKARRARIAAPKSIAVSVDKPKVTMTGPAQAKVTFRQSYRSDVLKTNSSKTVIMTKNDGRWQIAQEKSGS